MAAVQIISRRKKDDKPSVHLFPIMPKREGGLFFIFLFLSLLCPFHLPIRIKKKKKISIISYTAGHLFKKEEKTKGGAVVKEEKNVKKDYFHLSES